jgi:hypothetical protein
MIKFDASIDLTPRMIPDGVDVQAALVATRRAVQTLPGANWISVEYYAEVSATIPWIRVFLPGNSRVQSGQKYIAIEDDIQAVVSLSLSKG